MSTQAGNEYHIVVVSGGLQKPSTAHWLADHLSEATTKALEAYGHQSTTTVVEVSDLTVELANATLSYCSTPLVDTIKERLADADALIAVSPILKASYSGAFKMLFDVLDPDALRGKPVLIGASAGSVRHNLAIDHAIRPLFSFMHAEVIPTAVFASRDDAQHAEESGLNERINSAAEELAQRLISSDQ